MGEFAREVKKSAKLVLQQTFLPRFEPEMDPVVELIMALLEDGAGGVRSTPNVTVTTEQWLAWNWLATMQERLLIRLLTNELERERTALPKELDPMRVWAARSILSTLDRFEVI
jgi:hypothetical protein